MILTDLSNAIKNLWGEISFHKHFKDVPNIPGMLLNSMFGDNAGLRTREKM